MTGNKNEISPSGSHIYRYEVQEKTLNTPVYSPDVEMIEQHIEKHIGKIDTIYHELVSDLVHIDIYIIKPTPERNFITLITGGMSNQPMKAPPQVKDYQFAELMICLPPDWPISEQALKDENNYWPIRQLKFLARFPHEYDTWIWFGHTIPNGNPPQSFAENTKLSGIILAPPLLAPNDFFSLEINDNKTVYFFTIIPLYEIEMDKKLKKGSDDLFNHLDQQKVNELLNVNRPSVYKKGWWLF